MISLIPESTNFRMFSADVAGVADIPLTEGYATLQGTDPTAANFAVGNRIKNLQSSLIEAVLFPKHHRGVVITPAMDYATAIAASSSWALFALYGISLGNQATEIEGVYLSPFAVGNFYSAKVLAAPSGMFSAPAAASQWYMDGLTLALTTSGTTPKGTGSARVTALDLGAPTVLGSTVGASTIVVPNFGPDVIGVAMCAYGANVSTRRWNAHIATLTII